MFISLLNKFKSSKNQAVVASVYLFLSEYNEEISLDALSKELKLSKKNIELAAIYLIEHNYIEAIGQLLKIKNNVVIDEDVAEAHKEIIKNTTVQDSIIADLTKILDHLSNVSGTRFSRNSTYDKMIKRHLQAGYSVEDFCKVNQYFALEWNNPEMSNYITPRTLYNTNFPARVDEARKFFSDETAELYSQAGEILKVFAELRAQHNLPIFQPSSKNYKNVVFWVRRFSKDVIIELIKDLFNDWGPDVQNSVYLLPNIIFSEKFQTRMEKFLSKQKTVTVRSNKENIEQMFNYLQKIKAALSRNDAITKSDLLKSVTSVTLTEFLIYINESENMEKLKTMTADDMLQSIEFFLNK